MEELQLNVQQMIITERTERPHDNVAMQVVTVNSKGTDLKDYRFEFTLPRVMLSSFPTGTYLTVLINEDGEPDSILRPLPVHAPNETLLKQIRIDGISRSLRETSPGEYRVRVWGYDRAQRGAYIVEFVASTEVVQSFEPGGSLELMIDEDKYARKIIIGEHIINVSHLG